MVEDSGRNIGDFEYTRRFFCRALPTQLDDNDSPTLIIQSYYVHQDNYALRVRLKTKSVRIAMTPDLDPLAVLEKYRDEFRLGSVCNFSFTDLLNCFVHNRIFYWLFYFFPASKPLITALVKPPCSMVLRPLMVQPPGVVTLSMAASGCSPVS